MFDRDDGDYGTIDLLPERVRQCVQPRADGGRLPRAGGGQHPVRGGQRGDDGYDALRLGLRGGVKRLFQREMPVARFHVRPQPAGERGSGGKRLLYGNDTERGVGAPILRTNSPDRYRPPAYQRAARRLRGEPGGYCLVHALGRFPFHSVRLPDHERADAELGADLRP